MLRGQRQGKEGSIKVGQLKQVDLDYPIDNLNGPSPVEKYEPLSGASLAAVGQLELQLNSSDKLAEALR